MGRPAQSRPAGQRDKLSTALADIGFEVHDSAGTYFVCADPRPLGYDDSTRFCLSFQRRPVSRQYLSAFCDPARTFQ